MNWLCRIGIHKWGKWSEPKLAEATQVSFGREKEVTIMIQATICERCGCSKWRRV